MREETIFTAVSMINEVDGLSVVSLSSLYESAPQQIDTTKAFVNAVCKISSNLSPEELLDECQKIENELGRVRLPGLRDRTIDIDILLYGDISVSRNGLEIPHGKLRERGFVLVPLVEIEPDIVLPPEGVRAKDILRDIDLGKYWVRKISGRMVSSSSSKM